MAGGEPVNPAEYNEDEVNHQYDDALKRIKTWKGPRTGIGTVRKYAEEGGYRPPFVQRGAAQQQQQSPIVPFHLNAAVPVYVAEGMPPREFAGPPVGNAYLFPMHASSLFVSLGGVGKTSFIIAMAAHIAAGKPFGMDLKRRKVLVFCVEESQDELNRKYGACVHSWTDDDACVHSWTDEERSRAEENLRLVSCLDRDARLTRIDRRQVIGSGVADEMIRAANGFGAEVIVLDHLQGFVSGDLNLSDTATALAVELNKIVAATGAAVIITAHISKASIGAQDVLDGFTTGSLALENAARQVVGVIPLPDGDAKTLKLENVKSEYLLVRMPKNSYGPSREKAYLQKVYVPDFHTITVEPYTPVGVPLIRTAREALRDRVVEYLKNNPGMTPNRLDLLAGKKGPLKATRQEVRDVVKELQAEGVLILKTLTKDQRAALRLRSQIKQVYEYVG